MKEKDFDDFVVIEKDEENNIRDKEKNNYENENENAKSIIITYPKNDKDDIYKDYCILTKARIK